MDSCFRGNDILLYKWVLRTGFGMVYSGNYAISGSNLTEKQCCRFGGIRGWGRYPSIARSPIASRRESLLASGMALLVVERAT